MGKKDNVGKIKSILRVFTKYKYNLESENDIVVGEIKEYYSQNRRPPAALLMRWKQIQNLEIFTENNIYSLKNQLQLAQVGKSLSEAFEGANWDKEMKKTKNLIKQTKHIIESFSKIQSDLLLQGKARSKNMEDQLKSFNNLVDEKKISQEIMEPKVNEDEVLKSLIEEDKDFIGMLDEDTKKKLKINL